MQEASSSCCKATEEVISQLLQRINILESRQQTTADVVERFTSNQIDQMNTIASAMERIDETVGQQANRIQQIGNENEETMGRILRVSHNLKKTEQNITTIAGKVDTLEANWDKLKTKFDNIAVNPAAAAAAAGQEMSQQHDEKNAFFLGGIHVLRDFYQSPRADPAQIVRFLLSDVHLYCCME